MATPHACAALVDVFPDLLRARRCLVGTLNTPAVAALAVVHQHGPLRLSEVAEHLSLDLSTVSRQVSHLKAKGLLRATPDPDDGRSHRLTVTDAGVEDLRAFRRTVVDRLVGQLGSWHDEDVQDLTRLLGRLARTTGCTPATTPAPPENAHTHQENPLQANA
ncbi:MarR family winged helix-turn-helix transcriptional regulator [Kineococcus aurantiacus]|uniref:DNA-binding MarR family transcriptional regulator n=1 Tax=Kineococcus aurantiacus TaxID=37633 RepID=A0A7Y9ATB6_9ACTN|nr:MarR family winged helix-turn-helix transcriptional regulator [Kineococcus aurantiacus]NYD21361.1 DNA-binding MarR family transcriptional regulator [Kineococcus aurantiacus]